MSDVTAMAAAGAHARAKPAVTPLRRVRQIGYGVLGLQLIGFMTWSAILYDRFALTWDFSINHQAWYLIAHGNLNPVDSLHGFSFWRGHCEFIMWPLALLYWIWPHDVMLLWSQDMAVVGAELVVFTWICEIAAKHRRAEAAMFAAAGLVFLAADPWTWQSVSFDFHTETLMAFFLTLVTRDAVKGRRRAWAWTLLLLTCGDVAGTCLAGTGAGIALMRRSARRRGIGMACLGIGATLVITLVHGNLGSGGGLQAYAYLAGAAGSPLSVGALVKGMLTHPLLSVRTILAKRVNIWANLAPTGILGVGFVTLLPMAIVVLLANNLFPGQAFSVPKFQSVPLYILLPAGTISVLTWLYQRHRKTAVALTAVVVAQALAWAAVWAPTVPGSWLRVPRNTAATLTAVQASIPGDAEVIASQGVAGRFSGRRDFQTILAPGQIPVHGKTWFVITPTAGIETLSTASSMALISELAGPLGATLVTHADGVWVFRWRPPAGTNSVAIPSGLVPLKAWTSAGAAGRADLRGPVSNWHVTDTGGSGYVSDGMQWLVPGGQYQAVVTLSASGPVYVEVWDDTNDSLEARRIVPRTGGVQKVTMPVTVSGSHNASAYSGWGPFHIKPVEPRPGQRLEVRVWSPGSEAVNVYSATLTTVSGPGPAGRF